MEDRLRLRLRRTQRGSAYLYVIVCVSIMGLLAVELIAYSTQARTTQARRGRQAKAELATESLVQQVTAEALVQPIVSNSTRSLALNGATANVKVSDGSGVVPHSYYVSGTTTVDGQSFKIARYVTAGVGSTPYNFAIYSASDMIWAGKIVTGANGADGDVFSNGKIDLSSVPGSIVNGNISAKGSINLSGQTVTGNTIPNASDIPLPTYNATNYLTNASYVLTGPMTSTSGATFSGTVNGHYQIYYITGDVSFQGVISGQGIVFVNGNITLTGDVTYANSSSRVAIIATGDVTIGPTCTKAVGVLWTKGNFVVNSPDFNMTKGTIVANKIASGAIVRATRDNFMQTSSTEGTKLCLPGYWP